MACYCMDAIHLNGNVWINIPRRPDKMVSGMTTRCERAVKGERYFGIEVYIFYIYTEVFNCGLVLVRLYMHILYVCMDVITYG